jgi:8-oxo-dGTP pyrophosphatase MutT (NUDIX family)
MVENSLDWRRGAVLVPVLAGTPPGVVFVERGRHLRRHPGEIGFPGGIADPIDDGDPARTALRELREELGVDAARVSVVGQLADLEQMSSRFVITPIVGVLDAETTFAIDGDEIAGVFSVPLATVIANRAAGVLDYEGRHIWGFTSRILKAFVDAWSERDSSLRSAIEAAWR